MIKHLYFFNWALTPENFGVVLQDVKESIAQGHEITVMTCNGTLAPCFLNNLGAERYCTLCKYNVAAGIRHLDHPMKIVKIEELVDAKRCREIFDGQNFSYNSIEEIKELVYKGVQIGYGALSLYVTATRNREPVMDSNFRQYFDKLLYNSIVLKEATDAVIANVLPDRISLFNGRTTDGRAVFDTAIEKGIMVRSLENIVSGEKIQSVVFTNALPQSIDFQTKRILESWNNSPLDDTQKMEIASSFFEGRRNSQLVRDVKVYTLKQKKGTLPDNWDASKRNIVIFNSSEDEFAAIGSEFDSYFLFSSQEEGIAQICEKILDPQIHFYLRVHPNLTDISYGYHHRLYDLEKRFSNLTVIKADSPTSTYTLIDECEKVIVFGSTTGAEAAYARKPVVLLGGAFYYKLQMAYTPKNIAEAFKLIQAKLEPMKVTGALQYGHYLMNFESYSKPLTYKAKKVKVRGITVGYHAPHLKVFGSSAIFTLRSILALITGNIISKLNGKKKEYKLPIAGK
jgi:hypothetical protein